MKQSVDHVDPFHGNGPVDLPVPGGIAATWDWRKAQVGNTHPGPFSPFGMVSACAYSGAYPSGYGTCAPSCTGPTPAKYQRKTATGFTHFQHSGTGDIRAFYNYVRVIPSTGPIAGRYERRELGNETARPGYYGADLKDTGIRAELTVSGKAAFHRYTFPESGTAQIAIDACTGGLFDDELRKTEPTEVRVEIFPGQAAGGRVVMPGVPICFYVETDLGPDSARTDHGAVFTGSTRGGQRVNVRLGFSFRSIEQARDNMRSALRGSFDDVAAATRGQWREHLDRIRVTGGTDTQRVLGTTGESASIAADDRRQLVQLTAQCAAGRATVYAGISGNCLKESIEAALAADWDEVDRLQTVIDAMGQRYHTGRVLGEALAELKRVMSEMGLCGPYVLPPLRRR